jgi:hypothetical protein
VKGRPKDEHPRVTPTSDGKNLSVAAHVAVVAVDAGSGTVVIVARIT